MENDVISLSLVSELFLWDHGHLMLKDSLIFIGIIP